MNDSILINKPAGMPHGLVLLFHGVGANAQDMLPLGQAIASELPGSTVVSVAAPFVSDFGHGRQWFSVSGVTEENRSARVAEAMPAFVNAIRAQQASVGIGAEHTLLVGFSQGAIMSLESTQLPKPVAQGVVSIAGRFAKPTEVRTTDVEIHLLHGLDDRVIPASMSQVAYDRLRDVGGHATLDIFPSLGHGVDARIARRVRDLLRGHLLQPSES